MTPFADQSAYDVRLERGAAGLTALAEAGPTNVVVIDVLSFSTCVAVAVDRGARVWPYPGLAADAEAYASAQNAELAGHRGDPSASFSLSPASLASVRSDTRLVLPSPNGSELSFAAAGSCTVIAGCLLNRTAVARYLNDHPGSVALIAAGERWPDRSLRPCLEDFLGAGAIASRLEGGTLSPDARAAMLAYAGLEADIAQAMESCSSGRELIDMGFATDVEMASQVDVIDSVPILVDRAFARVEAGRG